MLSNKPDIQKLVTFPLHKAFGFFSIHFRKPAAAAAKRFA
jgi:hypothetical protein